MPDLDLDELFAELDGFAKPQSKRATYTPREERVIAGFEDCKFASNNDPLRGGFRVQ